jgi:hypothetical protein
LGGDHPKKPFVGFEYEVNGREAKGAVVDSCIPEYARIARPTRKASGKSYVYVK